MAHSDFSFSAHHLEPIDSSRLVTRLRRSSLEDLRSQTVSPSASLRGVYVRSRATSPMNSQESLNMIFHPDDDYTEFEVPSFQRTNWNPHLATSFASFAGMQGSAPATSSPATTAHIHPRAVETRAGLGYQETPGPPPGYTLENDEVILYMKDERSFRDELAVLIAQRPNRQYFHSPHASSSSASTHVSSPVDNHRAFQVSSPGTDSPRNSVRFAAMDTLIHPHSVKRTPHVANFREAIRNMRTARDTNADAAAVAPGDELEHSGPFSNDSDDKDEAPAEAPLPKQKKGFFVFKAIQRFRFGSASHRKAASSDAISLKTTSTPSTSTEKEKVKSSSASMFTVRPRTPSTKSVASTATKKRVLVKKGKAPAAPAATPVVPRSPTDIALLTSSSRAIEHKHLRRRSASFSGFANVAQPVEWKVPEDLDCEELEEAMRIAANLRSWDDWVYKREPTELMDR